MPNPEEALRQSSQHVDAEMAQLGQLTPTQVTTSVPVMPEDLQRLVTFKWSGPLDQGVAKLAQSVGYTFFVTAPPGARRHAQPDGFADSLCVRARPGPPIARRERNEQQQSPGMSSSGSTNEGSLHR
jgi:hypothetical protein